MPHLVGWLARNKPDVVCLQETKCEDAKFPGADIEAAGYRWVHHGQKTYNGVALLARSDCVNVARGIPGFEDEQRRVIVGDIGDTRVVSVYVPNGQSVGSDKYQYKLRWFEALGGWLRGQLAAHPRVAVLGDFNVAPEDRDVHDPALWAGQVLCSEPERAAFREFLAAGLTDSFRLFDQPPNTFSWWDYRMLAFPKNRGLRIDHILLTAPLAARCTASRIDRNARKGEKPSDHAPAIVELRDA